MNTEHNGWYNKIFSAAYDPVMGLVEKNALRGRRKDLLSSLGGNILEIGSGTGVNFEFYGVDAKVLALEPSDAMRAQATTRLGAKKFAAKIRIEPWLLEDPKARAAISAGSLDAAVCTLVLCTVPEPAAILTELRRLLKPEGKLVILEHVRAQSDAGKFAQNFMNPLWRHMADGCQLNRNTHEAILTAGFSPVQKADFAYGLPFISGIYVPV